MRFTLIACLVSATLAFPTIEKRGDFDTWAPKGPGEVRSPCPALNALANHGILPRSGKGITQDQLVQAMAKIGMGETVTKLLFKGGGILGLLDGQLLNLDRLAKHNGIEHDGSLSREDAALGNNNDFNQTIFNDYLSHFNGQDVIPIGKAGQARYARLKKEQTADKKFTYGPFQAFCSNGETALLFSVIGSVDRQEINKQYMTVFFQEERFPYKEGWRPRTTLVTALDVANLFIRAVVQSGEAIEGFKIATIANLRNILNKLPDHWGAEELPQDS